MTGQPAATSTVVEAVMSNLQGTLEASSLPILQQHTKLADYSWRQQGEP